MPGLWRETWVRIAAAWWAWLVLCSVPGIGIGGWWAFGQAVAVVRYPALVAALQFDLLGSAALRLWLRRVLTACALYIGASALLQFATGRDLAGWPRGPDGELTGPFQKPRAGAPLARLMFPTLLPPLAHLAGAGRLARAVSLAAGAVGTMVLIGQRMPLLLTGLGAVTAGLLLRRLRLAVLAAILAGAGLLAMTAVVSPPTWYRLVTKFSAQMGDFAASDYGRIAGRAMLLAEQRPWTGWGFAGYRLACPQSGGDTTMCNIHPHNHYLEAVTDAGVPGLLLFSALAGAWLWRLGRGMGQSPLRVGLFVAAGVELWPLASASSFYAVELAGFFFILLGIGLAEAGASTRQGAHVVGPVPTH